MKLNQETTAPSDEKPLFAIITQTDISDEQSVNSRRVAKTPNDVSYTIAYTYEGVTQIDAGVGPSQQRYDCWFYPAMPGDIARMYWVENEYFITVVETPVSDECPPPDGGTPQLRGVFPRGPRDMRSVTTNEKFLADIKKKDENKGKR